MKYQNMKVGEGDDRAWGGWMESPTQWTWIWVNSGFGDGQGGLGAAVHLAGKSRTRLRDWTELSQILIKCDCQIKS